MAASVLRARKKDRASDLPGGPLVFTFGGPARTRTGTYDLMRVEFYQLNYGAKSYQVI